MDTTNLIAEKFNHNLAKKNLREKNQQSLTYSHAGGLFYLNAELFSMLQLFSDQEEIIIEDSFGNPILIKDIHDFAYKCKTRYNEVMNNWLIEYERIKKIRKPSQI